MQRVFVAVPAYDGKIGVETARALLIEQNCAISNGGVSLTVAFLPGCSLITMARNQMAADFLMTDNDRLVFVDSDVSWEPGDLLKLAKHEADVVGGAYRLKQPAIAWPVIWDESKPELHAVDGLLEVLSLPAGFLAISRKALERLKAAHPERTYTHMGHKAHAFFHAPFADGRLWGEDAAFCADWRAIGGKVWLDPNPTLTHVGGASHYAGCIGDWLKGRT